jgi:hypothetical protein
MTGAYRLVIVDGDLLDLGMFLSAYGSYANPGIAALSKISKGENVVAVPAGRLKKDRTYSSAVEVKSWLVENYQGHFKINVVSLDVQARRLRMRFKIVFGSAGSIA